MNSVKKGKVTINRCMYKDIKKFDRVQMDRFLQDIYDQGVKDGKANNNFNIDDFINQCCVKFVMTKGFGIKKTDTAREVLLNVAKEKGLKPCGEK